MLILCYWHGFNRVIIDYDLGHLFRCDIKLLILVGNLFSI